MDFGGIFVLKDGGFLYMIEVVFFMQEYDYLPHHLPFTVAPTVGRGYDPAETVS